MLKLIKEDLWCQKKTGWFDRLRKKNEEVTAGEGSKKLCDYIRDENILDLSDGKFVELNEQQKEQLKVAFSLQSVISHWRNRDKFPLLGPILERVHSLSLNKNGKKFGLAGIQWVGDIISSKHSLIDSVAMEEDCGLDDKCIEWLVEAFKSSRENASSRKKQLKLRFLSMHYEFEDDKLLKSMKEELLNPQYTNIQEICINSKDRLYPANVVQEHQEPLTNLDDF